MTTIDNSNNSTTNTTLAPTGATERAYYQAMLPLAREIPAGDVMQVNLDPAAICPIIVAVADRLEPQRATFTALSHFDITNLDTLRASAFALSIAHSAYEIAMTPPDSLPELAGRGQVVLKAFQAFVPSLSYAGLIDSTRFDGLRSPVGYRDLVTALNAYMLAFRGGDIEQMKHKSPLTDELLAEAESICQQLTAIVGHRVIDPERLAEMADIRSRMFTLCVSRYDQLRRAASYLRWESGDAETLVPSLYNTGRRKADPKSEIVKPAAAPVTATTQAAPNGGTHTVQVASHEVGMPGGSPFGMA